MDERVAVAAAVLIVVAGAVPLVAAQSSASPTITVSADADPLDPGDVHHTPTDPLVRVQVAADTPVSLVEVRVDGITRHAFEPSGERVDRSVSLDLETGSHRLTVVARADDTATYGATIVKDDEAPVVNYSAPFDSGASNDDADAPPSSELTVNRGNVSVNGTLDDLSAIDTVRVDHAYDYQSVDGDARTDERQYLLPGSGGEFNQSLALVPGSNRITVRAEDAVGNVRTHEFTIAVDDGTAPSLTVTDIEWVSSTRLHIEGRVTDRVQVQSVWLESEDDDVTRHPLVFPQATAPDRTRRTLEIDTTVYHPPGDDYVVLGANDTAGNEQTWNYSLATFLAPNVTVADDRTGYVDDRTVAVGGRVVDGQVREVSVEAIDPATGRIVDIRPVALGADGSFDARLGAVPDETRVRVRVRDASGAEHLTNVTVTAPLDPTPTPTPSTGDADDGTTAPAADDGAGDGAADTTANETGTDGVRVPVVGVVIPTPAVGLPGPLGASVAAPLPVIGPVDIPLIAGAPILLVAVAIARRVRGG
jgi:hypothetical protein